MSSCHAACGCPTETPFAGKYCVVDAWPGIGGFEPAREGSGEGRGAGSERFVGGGESGGCPALHVWRAAPRAPPPQTETHRRERKNTTSSTRARRWPQTASPTRTSSQRHQRTTPTCRMSSASAPAARDPRRQRARPNPRVAAQQACAFGAHLRRGGRDPRPVFTACVYFFISPAYTPASPPALRARDLAPRRRKTCLSGRKPGGGPGRLSLRVRRLRAAEYEGVTVEPAAGGQRPRAATHSGLRRRPRRAVRRE